MKTKVVDLDVDFIGGQGSLTTTEEHALSEFFKQRKLKSKQAIHKGFKITKRIKEFA